MKFGGEILTNFQINFDSLASSTSNIGGAFGLPSGQTYAQTFLAGKATGWVITDLIVIGVLLR